jgi:HAAS
MADKLIDRYLRDLRAEIQDHIDSALAETHPRDEASVRNVLERLGDPSEIADEARERMGIAKPKAGFREIAAVILLPIGGILIPVIGWIIGLLLLWSSPVWTSRDKWIGSLIIPGGLMLPFELFFFSTTECSGSDPCGPSGLESAAITVGFALAVAAPIVTAIYLARRANTLSRG